MVVVTTSFDAVGLQEHDARAEAFDDADIVLVSLENGMLPSQIDPRGCC